MKAWHFIKPDHTLRYDLEGVTVEVGQTLTVQGPITLCKSGLHASINPLDALRYAPGLTVCRVELDGEIITDKDKCVASERTVVAMADATTVIIQFAQWCADRAAAYADRAALDAAYAARAADYGARAAARAAAYATRAAAYAARAAAYAALAADYAARAAAYAARAADYGARAAARAAEYAARDAKYAARAAANYGALAADYGARAADYGALDAEASAQNDYLAERLNELLGVHNE